MAKPLSSNKRELEKNKSKKRLDKLKRKEERKNNSKGGSFEDMLAYVDENGVISSTPPDMSNKTEIDVESIQLSIPKKTDIAEDSVYKGRVEHYNESKGFGFIKDLSSIEKYFFHISEVTGNIEENKIVTFELAKGTRGLNAVKIKLFVEEPKQK